MESVIAPVVGDSVLLEVVCSDLVASVDGGDLARSGAALPLLLLAELLLGELSPQNGEGLFFVFVLRALVLDADNDACWEMHDSDGRLGCVDVLAAGSAGTHDVDPELVGLESAEGVPSGVVVVHLGQDDDAGGRGVDTALCFCGGDALDTVDAGLVAETVVGAAVVDNEGGLGDAGAGDVVCFRQDLVSPAVQLAVLDVHGEEVCGKDVCLVAACTGTQLENGRLVGKGVLRQELGLELACDPDQVGHGGLQLELGLVDKRRVLPVCGVHHVEEGLVVLVQGDELVVDGNESRQTGVALVLVDVELAALGDLVLKDRDLVFERLGLLEKRRMQSRHDDVQNVFDVFDVVMLAAATATADSTSVQACDRCHRADPQRRANKPCRDTRKPESDCGAKRPSKHHLGTMACSPS